MTFIRKHYELIADILAPYAQAERTDPHSITFRLVQGFADLFKEDNERFGRDRFFARVYKS